MKSYKFYCILALEFLCLLPVLCAPVLRSPVMNVCNLEKRVHDAVERWTVFRLIESHMEAAVLERFKESVYRCVLLCSKRLLVDRGSSIEALATAIYDFLGNADVDVDIHSCRRMASILEEIYTEFVDGRSDIYQKLVQARPAECEYESSE